MGNQAGIGNSYENSSARWVAQKNERVTLLRLDYPLSGSQMMRVGGGLPTRGMWWRRVGPEGRQKSVSWEEDDGVARFLYCVTGHTIE
jgi:hypothetical protein